jgi:hypothetical protein
VPARFFRGFTGQPNQRAPIDAGRSVSYGAAREPLSRLSCASSYGTCSAPFFVSIDLGELLLERGLVGKDCLVEYAAGEPPRLVRNRTSATIDMAAIYDGPLKIRLDNSRRCEIGAREVCTDQLGPTQVTMTKSRAHEDRVAEGCMIQTRPLQVGTVQTCFRELRCRKIRVDQQGAAQDRPHAYAIGLWRHLIACPVNAYRSTPP